MLLEKYGMQEEDLEDKAELHWFPYTTDTDKRLLEQIIANLFGNKDTYSYAGKYKRRKKMGVYCTTLEEAEIKLMYSFYKEEYRKEEETFWIAFVSKKNLFRKRVPGEEYRTDFLDEEEERKWKKAAEYTMFIDGSKPPRALIGEDVEDW